MTTFEELLKNAVNVEFIDPGSRVYCDDCGKDCTNSNKSGGLLFQSKAICQDCSPKWEARAKQYGEEHFIRARCPEGMSFYSWVILLRDRPRIED